MSGTSRTGNLVVVPAPPLRPRESVHTRLGALLDGWPDARLITTDGPGGRPDSEETDVTGVTLSSQRVAPGDLYVAPQGSRSHGATYAADAVAAGAVAVLTDPAGLEHCRHLAVPVVVVEEPRRVLGELSAQVYGRPAERLALLAVTGTQGKTTTTRLAEEALTRSGEAAAVIGTVGTRILGEDVKTALTTPEAPDLHALFAVMLERGVRSCAMEVSSHALVMGRVDGVIFDVACFLNLGRDHLDFHGDEEDYFQAKATLFTPVHSRLALVNVDDAHGRRLVDQAGVPVRTFSTRGRAADWAASDAMATPTGSDVVVHGPRGVRVPLSVPLTGSFNVANALCAVAGLAELGFDPVRTAIGLGSAAGVPGRVERISAGQDFLAVVDYAHKPDAVRAVLSALREQTHGRLVIVIGAGGERDAGKRPLMGRVAAELADVVVVTDDNPRAEEPAAIRAAVLRGAVEVPVERRAEVHEVGDRRAAIRLAVSGAAAGDTVVVAGKGHETGQEVDGVTMPFDDREVLREELGSR